MREKTYVDLLERIHSEINDGVCLMTLKEEMKYRERIIKDLIKDLKEFEKIMGVK